jgi:hypothetical protein
VVEGRLLEILAGFFVILSNNLDTPGCGFYTWPKEFILISIHKPLASIKFAAIKHALAVTVGRGGL